MIVNQWISFQKVFKKPIISGKQVETLNLSQMFKSYLGLRFPSSFYITFILYFTIYNI